MEKKAANPRASAALNTCTKTPKNANRALRVIACVDRRPNRADTDDGCHRHKDDNAEGFDDDDDDVDGNDANGNGDDAAAVKAFQAMGLNGVVTRP